MLLLARLLRHLSICLHASILQLCGSSAVRLHASLALLLLPRSLPLARRSSSVQHCCRCVCFSLHASLLKLLHVGVCYVAQLLQRLAAVLACCQLLLQLLRCRCAGLLAGSKLQGCVRRAA
jgi:hypothetical protein